MFPASTHFHNLSLPTFRACERCMQEKRKTINGEDIIWAMEALGFENYAHLMKVYLNRYKEVNTKSSPPLIGDQD